MLRRDVADSVWLACGVGEGAGGRLAKGTRGAADAARNWEMEYADAFLEMGFRQGVASSRVLASPLEAAAAGIWRLGNYGYKTG